MSNVVGQGGRLDMTIEITRKDTGKTETVKLVGFVDEADLERFRAAQKEASNGEEG